MRAGLGKQGPESPQPEAAGIWRFIQGSHFPMTPSLRRELELVSFPDPPRKAHVWGGSGHETKLESGDIQLSCVSWSLGGDVPRMLDVPTHPCHTVLT